MNTKRIGWSMVAVAVLAAITPGMTFGGFLWLLVLVPVVMLLVRFCLSMVIEDPRQTQRPNRVDGATDHGSVAAIPHGWEMEDYVVDGLRCLRIHLIQSARHANP